ncbi:hypothetical protein C8024_00585 [Sphingopyxis sp. BSNA05]|nr:hypothetical protein [Sphingopyxis sp. BSNA05]
MRRHRDLITDNLLTADAKAKRKLVWLANYHNTFLNELRSRYDMDDASGKFYAELEMKPCELFDSLVVEGSWTGLIDNLVEIGKNLSS